MGHLDTFAWVGGFFIRSQYQTPGELVQIRLRQGETEAALLSCGNRMPDQYQPGVHAYLKEKGVPHIWHVTQRSRRNSLGNALYLFAQRLFREWMIRHGKPQTLLREK